MSPSLWRLAVAGCVLSAAFVAPASSAAVDASNQPIQNLLKFNLLQTVTHISNPIGKKDVEPKTISRTEIRRFVMAEAATNKWLKIYSPARTEATFQMLAKSNGYALINEHLACITGQHVQTVEEVYENKPMPDMAQVCLRLLGVSADVQRNPELKAKDTRRDLLSPLRSILKDKGVAPTDANALYLAQQISKMVSENPSIAHSADTFEFELFEGQTAPFKLFPGMVHHAEFVKGFFDQIKDGMPPINPGFPPALVVSNTRECHDGNGLASNGTCQLTARANLLSYLNDRQVAALVR